MINNVPFLPAKARYGINNKFKVPNGLYSMVNKALEERTQTKPWVNAWDEIAILASKILEEPW